MCQQIAAARYNFKFMDHMDEEAVEQKQLPAISVLLVLLHVSEMPFLNDNDRLTLTISMDANRQETILLISYQLSQSSFLCINTHIDKR